MHRNKMNNSLSNTNKSAQEQRSMQHRQHQQQQKQQDRQQRNQQHSQCNKALKIGTKKTGTMNGDTCNHNKTNNKHALLKTDIKKSKNEANNNKENNYREKNNQQTQCAYNHTRNQSSYKTTKITTRSTDQIISSGLKSSDKRQIDNSKYNLIAHKSTYVPKQQRPQSLMPLNNASLQNAVKAIKPPKTSYMTSKCQPGILYSEVVFGVVPSAYMLKMKAPPNGVTKTEVKVGAQPGALTKLATPSVQSGATLLNCGKSTAPEIMPPKSSERTSTNPDLSSTSFNKSTSLTSSMFAKSGNDRGNANGPGYNNNNNRANGNSNAVGTDPYKIYGNVIPTNNFHSKQEMMPVGVATTPKVIQGPTTLPTMIPNSTKFASNGGMTIQNGLTNAMPIKCYNNHGVAFGRGLEKYFPNQSNIQYANNQVIHMNPITTMPGATTQMLATTKAMPAPIMPIKPPTLPMPASTVPMPILPILSLPMPGMAASIMPMPATQVSMNGNNGVALHKNVLNFAGLASNVQNAMKVDAVTPCTSTNSPEPFFFQMPKWNLIDVGREVYPKLLRQFDDENYLKLEAAALIGYKLAERQFN